MAQHTFDVGDPVWVFDTNTMEDHDGTVTALDGTYKGHVEVTLGDGPFKVNVHPSRIRHRIHAVEVNPFDADYSVNHVQEN